MAGERKRRCSLAWLEAARDSHYFEKLHLGWEKKGILADTELSLGCPCVQGEIPECQWGWDPHGAVVLRPGLQGWVHVAPFPGF